MSVYNYYKRKKAYLSTFFIYSIPLKYSHIKNNAISSSFRSLVFKEFSNKDDSLLIANFIKQEGKHRRILNFSVSYSDDTLLLIMINLIYN